MLASDDIEKDRRDLLEAGAKGLDEIADGSLAELGSAPVTNGDPASGNVDVPGARLAVVQLANGNRVGAPAGVARVVVTTGANYGRVPKEPARRVGDEEPRPCSIRKEPSMAVNRDEIRPFRSDIRGFFRRFR